MHSNPPPSPPFFTPTILSILGTWTYASSPRPPFSPSVSTPNNPLVCPPPSLPPSLPQASVLSEFISLLLAQNRIVTSSRHATGEEGIGKAPSPSYKAAACPPTGTCLRYSQHNNTALEREISTFKMTNLSVFTVQELPHLFLGVFVRPFQPLQTFTFFASSSFPPFLPPSLPPSPQLPVRLCLPPARPPPRSRVRPPTLRGGAERSARERTSSNAASTLGAGKGGREGGREELFLSSHSGPRKRPPHPPSLPPCSASQSARRRRRPSSVRTDLSKGEPGTARTGILSP